MIVHLRDTNPEIVSAWRSAGAIAPPLEASQGDIFLAGRADAIVAAGNSAGRMDGGLDLVYRDHFGRQIEREVQAAIRRGWGLGGLLPVGEAVTVHTGNDAIPLMIYAPTMERPMDVSGTQNAYLAFRAALREARYIRASTLLCPGLCTLTGRMAPEQAASQMLRAWLEVR